MAATTFSSFGFPGVRHSAATRTTSTARLCLGANSSSKQENTVVIVGAGIAGLATALAFHRLGIRVLVLEQQIGVRAGGSIALWKNAWRALDVLGVGDELREKHYLLAGTNVISAEGKLLHHLDFSNSSEERRKNEVRAVERAALLEALAKPLPDGTIQFGSKVVGVRPAEGSTVTEVVLDDASVIRSKILVGCDGVRSQVAKFVGMREPVMVGQCAIRGVANLPEGHDYKDVLLQFLGRGSRAGVVPISSTKVYWFVSFKCSSGGTMNSDVKLVKGEALHYFSKTCRSRVEEFSKLVENTPGESLNRSSLKDRWSLPLPSSEYGITLAGDALHPMTPNLGQGGCLALEDAVILARHVYNTAFAGNTLSSASVNRALVEYSRQRWQRYFPLTIKSYLVGFLSMIDFPVVVYLRDKLGVKLTLDPDRFLSHTRYDCGELRQATAKL